jgi:CBS domain-containing protein
MKVADILEVKARSLKMIKPYETIGKLARQLQQNRIGVMIVSDHGRAISGIVSERDIAYSLADRRGELHLLPVSAVMTKKSHHMLPRDKLIGGSSPNDRAPH